MAAATIASSREIHLSAYAIVRPRSHLRLSWSFPDGVPRKVRVEYRSRKRGGFQQPWSVAIGGAIDQVAIGELEPDQFYHIGIRERLDDNSWAARSLFRLKTPTDWSRPASVRVVHCSPADTDDTPQWIPLAGQDGGMSRRIESYLIAKARHDLPDVLVGSADDSSEQREKVVRWAVLLLEGLVANHSLRGDKRRIVRSLARALLAIIWGRQSDDPDRLPPVEIPPLTQSARIRNILVNCIQVASPKAGKASQVLRSLRNIMKLSSGVVSPTDRLVDGTDQCSAISTMFVVWIGVCTARKFAGKAFPGQFHVEMPPAMPPTISPIHE